MNQRPVKKSSPSGARVQKLSTEQESTPIQEVNAAAVLPQEKPIREKTRQKPVAVVEKPEEATAAPQKDAQASSEAASGPPRIPNEKRVPGEVRAVKAAREESTPQAEGGNQRAERAPQAAVAHEQARENQEPAGEERAPRNEQGHRPDRGPREDRAPRGERGPREERASRADHQPQASQGDLPVREERAADGQEASDNGGRGGGERDPRGQHRQGQPGQPGQGRRDQHRQGGRNARDQRRQGRDGREGGPQQQNTQQPALDDGRGGRRGGQQQQRSKPHDRHQRQPKRHPQGQGQDQREREELKNAPVIAIEGILEHRKDGTAVLRRVTGEAVYGDAFIGANLRPVDYRTGVVVQAEAANVPGRGFPMTVRKITGIDGEDPVEARNVAPFERGTVIDPIHWLKLETGKDPSGPRLIDLFCPIGKGTRGLIVAPPRSGKTVLLKEIAAAIVANHPEVKLMILLVDERPEEVTDFTRSVPEAEVWASSNDSSIQSHIDLVRLCISRAKRIVERGGDVVILLDSLTRLARAFNASGEGAKGRTMSGGMAAGAMQEPRAIFGASRCLEDAGSLTIIATALVETGSAMDELIFQEFKGTGNMELVLDRKLAEKRLFPAIDIHASGTRKDEKLMDEPTHKRVTLIRRYLSGMDLISGVTKLHDVIGKTNSNADLLKMFEP